MCASKQHKYPYPNIRIFLLHKTNRLLFPCVCVCVYCNRSQKTSQRVKNSHTTRHLLVSDFSVLYTLWRHLWFITVHTHGKNEIYLLNIRVILLTLAYVIDSCIWFILGLLNSHIGSHLDTAPYKWSWGQRWNLCLTWLSFQQGECTYLHLWDNQVEQPNV